MLKWNKLDNLHYFVVKPNTLFKESRYKNLGLKDIEKQPAAKSDALKTTKVKKKINKLLLNSEQNSQWL